MIEVQPIKGIRPKRELAHLVASRAVNTYSKSLLNAILGENKYTFLHIVLPEFGSKQTTKVNSLERFELVRDKFNLFRERGNFIQDKTPSFYIYKQHTKNKSFTGIIGACSIHDYLSGKIKVHEQTLRKREETFTDYLETCEFNAEPVLLAYDEIESVEKILKRYANQRPEYEFTTTDDITHSLWIVNNTKEIATIKNSFSKLDALYIADGHHRTASSAGLAARKILSGKKIRGNEMFNYCLSYFISSKQLQILEYNRLLKDIGNLQYDNILSLIENSFNVKELTTRGKPKHTGEMLMYMNAKWYQLVVKNEIRKNLNLSEKLDSSILTNFILDPVFGITDLTHDNRIDFAGGNLGADYLENCVNKGYAKIAFYLHPIAYRDLKRVADKNLIMPPKSTYILPKLRSGLLIHSLK